MSFHVSLGESIQHGYGVGFKAVEELRTSCHYTKMIILAICPSYDSYLLRSLTAAQDKGSKASVHAPYNPNILW